LTAGESISSSAELDEPEIWREADGVVIPIPKLPELLNLAASLYVVSV
jgi:hypothetical protein